MTGRAFPDFRQGVPSGRRRASGFVALLLCSALFAGCGKGPNEADPVSGPPAESGPGADAPAPEPVAADEPGESPSPDLKALLGEAASPDETSPVPTPVQDAVAEVPASFGTIPPRPPEGPPLLPPNFARQGTVTRQATVRLEPGLQEIGRRWLESEEGRQDFAMPLPGGDEVVVRVDRFVAVGDEGGEFHGSLEGYPGSSVHFSYRGGAEVGTIRIPSENRLIQVVPGPNGEITMNEIEVPEGESIGPPSNLALPPGPPPDFTPVPPTGMGGMPPPPGGG